MTTEVTEIAGSHTNGTMEDEDSPKRDVKNHMLFEVSTEAANRGHLDVSMTLSLLTPKQLVGFTQ